MNKPHCMGHSVLPKHRDTLQLLKGHFCSPVHLDQNTENTLLWGCGWIFCPQIQFENYCGRSFCLGQETRLSPCTEHNLTKAFPWYLCPTSASSIHHFTASLRHKRLFIGKSNSRKSFVVLCFQKSCHLAAENNKNLHSVLCQELPRQSEVLFVSADITHHSWWNLSLRASTYKAAHHYLTWAFSLNILLSQSAEDIP